MPTKDPRVLVLPTRYVEGWSGSMEELADVPVFSLVPLREALSTRWPTDAHMVQYTVPLEDKMPRLNKSSVAALLAGGMEASVPEQNILCLDVDLPEHGKWTWDNRDRWPPTVNQWYGQLQGALEAIPELQHAGLYLTRAGLRLLWPLAQPIAVTLAESYMAQFIDYLTRAGMVAIDPLTDWSRLFRMPFVIRDGVAQERAARFEQMRPLTWEAPNLVDLGPTASGSISGSDTMPDTRPGKPRLSDLKSLQDHELYMRIRTEEPVADEGSRHQTVLKLVGYLVWKLRTNDPQTIWALLHHACVTITGLPAGEFWDLCVWCCRTFDGGRQLEREEKQDAYSVAAKRMKCAPGEVHQRLVMTTRDAARFYVWNMEKGEWDQPVSSTALHSALKASHALHDIPRNAPAANVLHRAGTVVDRVVLSYIHDRTEYDPDQNQLFEAVGRIPKGLAPAYNEHIDRWLGYLFASQQSRAMDWLAKVVETDRPLPALYIQGGSGIGKSLVAGGIASVWGTPPVSYSEVIGSWQERMTSNPLIWADEKVPENPFVENDSSVFRRIVGNADFIARRRYMPAAPILGFPRVLITANNSDALHIREHMSSDDLEAVVQRVAYVRSNDDASDVLMEIAAQHNMKLHELGTRWVQGKQIAAHILWLNQNREVRSGDRFAVDAWPSSYGSELAVKSPHARLIGTYIINVLRDASRSLAVIYGDGEVWVDPAAVLENWAVKMQGRPPGDLAMREAASMLSDKRQTMKSNRGGERYYYRMPIDRLMLIAKLFKLCPPQTILRAANQPRETDQGPQTIDFE